MELSAVIFDMDGTVLADEHVYGLGFKKVLESLGAKNVSDYPHVSGIGVAENWPILIEKYLIKTDKTPDQLSLAVHEYYLSHVTQVKVKKGFGKLADELRSEKVLLGLATSSVWRITEAALKSQNINEFFDVVTTGEEVAHKKPSPDIFLLTADKLSVDHKQCVVFEDAKVGIEAAMSAQMPAIGIYKDEEHRESLSKARKLIHDFTQITVEEIRSLITATESLAE